MYYIVIWKPYFKTNLYNMYNTADHYMLQNVYMVMFFILSLPIEANLRSRHAPRAAPST